MCYVPLLTSHQQRHRMHNLDVKYQFQNTVVIKFHHMYSKCFMFRSFCAEFGAPKQFITSTPCIVFIPVLAMGWF